MVFASHPPATEACADAVEARAEADSLIDMRRGWPSSEENTGAISAVAVDVAVDEDGVDAWVEPEAEAEEGEVVVVEGSEVVLEVEVDVTKMGALAMALSFKYPLHTHTHIHTHTHRHAVSKNTHKITPWSFQTINQSINPNNMHVPHTTVVINTHMSCWCKYIVYTENTGVKKIITCRQHLWSWVDEWRVRLLDTHATRKLHRPP